MLLTIASLFVLFAGVSGFICGSEDAQEVPWERAWSGSWAPGICLPHLVRRRCCATWCSVGTSVPPAPLDVVGGCYKCLSIYTAPLL